MRPPRSLPYGRQSVDEGDIEAVSAVLRSDWLTTGPTVDAFERAVAAYVGADHAVAVSSGTAALHAAMHAIGIRAGDEVILPPMTFAATANAVVYCGGIPIFADVCDSTLLINPSEVERKITRRTKAVVAVDYAGQPCDYTALREIGLRHGVTLVADGCHALGARYGDARVGSLAESTAFSFHPVKHITTGEGGMVTTSSAHLADRMRAFRNHGITTDHRQRAASGSWFYQMVELGFNYRISDFQCALGLHQIERLDEWLLRRRTIAARYDEMFAGSEVQPLAVRTGVSNAYHLYVVRVPGDRQSVLEHLRAAGIGANVHYIPVYLHPFYRGTFGYLPGLCPVAEAAYERIVTLPLFPAMTDDDVSYVAHSVIEAVG